MQQTSLAATVMARVTFAAIHVSRSAAPLDRAKGDKQKGRGGGHAARRNPAPSLMMRKTDAQIRDRIRRRDTYSGKSGCVIAPPAAFSPRSAARNGAAQQAFQSGHELGGADRTAAALFNRYHVDGFGAL